MAEAQRFGIHRLRPGQREVIEAVFAGEDVLAIMPTGAGKSLTYQLPSVLLDGSVVVVSPLISLMQDQHTKAADADISAANLSSATPEAQVREAKREIRRGEHDVIFVTPERLENPEYLSLLKSSNIALLVVDEAHCVSQWGHDFRPAFLSLRDARRELGNPPLLALTATATPEVSEDILKQLGTKDAKIINTGIERENLFFEVFRTVNGDAKRERVRQLIDEVKGSAIIYCATVRTCNELWEWLHDSGVDVGRYHGKLTQKVRREAQERFMSNECPAMVATKAFGLGIDKPDVRLVCHFQFPDSLESYYQEAGRAGRDGEPSQCALLYRLEDKRVQSFFLGGKYPSREQSQRVYSSAVQMSAMPEHAKGIAVSDLATVADLPLRKTQVVVALLDAVGILSRRNRRIKVERQFSSGEELQQVLSEYEERGMNDRERLATIMQYAQSTMCRMQFMREYFGEDPGSECDHCDNCRARREGRLDDIRAAHSRRRGKGTQRQPRLRQPIDAEPRIAAPPDSPVAPEKVSNEPIPFSTGERVRHETFGDGEVTAIDGDRIEVKFIRSGKKKVRPEYLKSVA